MIRRGKIAKIHERALLTLTTLMLIIALCETPVNVVALSVSVNDHTISLANARWKLVKTVHIDNPKYDSDKGRINVYVNVHRTDKMTEALIMIGT